MSMVEVRVGSAWNLGGNSEHIPKVRVKYSENY